MMAILKRKNKKGSRGMFSGLSLKKLTGQVTGFWRSIPSWVLFRHFRLCSSVLVIVGVVVALIISSWLLLREPAVETVDVSAARVELTTELVDEVELWIQERSREQQRTLGGWSEELFN